MDRKLEKEHQEERSRKLQYWKPPPGKHTITILPFTTKDDFYPFDHLNLKPDKKVKE